MKFKKQLDRQRYNGWINSYVDYKALKQAIGHTDTTLFERKIYEEANKVNALYITRIEGWENEFIKTCTTIQESVKNGQHAQKEHVHHFGRMCARLDRMRAFVIINHVAFIKALKKKDKKGAMLGETPKRTQFMKVIMEQPFYKSPKLAEMITMAEVTAQVMTGKPTRSTFQCTLCMGIVRESVVLPCAHFFCRKCITEMQATAPESVEMACPTCQRKVPLNVDSFEVNGVLDSFVRQHFPQEYAQAVLEKPEAQSGPPSNTQTSTPAENFPLWSAKQLLQVIRSVSNAKCGPLDTEDTKQGAPDMDFVQFQPSLDMPQRDEHGVFTLPAFKYLLKHAKPGAYIILDIDETIHINPYNCQFMTEQGLQVYQEILVNNPLYKDVPLLAKNKSSRILQQLLASKRFVEHYDVSHPSFADSTGEVIRQLKRAGCYVFALTARYPSQSAVTHRELLSLGVNLVESSPFPASISFRDNVTGALYDSGVIYTNATEKGPILDRFLRALFNVEGPLASFPRAKLPTEVVFVDDRHANCLSVYQHLSVAEDHGFPVSVYHYDLVRKQRGSCDTQPQIDIDVVQVQVHHFLFTNTTLSDDEARDVLQKCTADKLALQSSSSSNESNSSEAVIVKPIPASSIVVL